MLLIPPSEICMCQVTCEKCDRSQRTWLFPELSAKTVLKWSRLQMCHPHQYLAGELAGVGPVVNYQGLGVQSSPWLSWVIRLGLLLWRDLAPWAAQTISGTRTTKKGLLQDGKSIQTEAEIEKCAHFLKWAGLHNHLFFLPMPMLCSLPTWSAVSEVSTDVGEDFIIKRKGEGECGGVLKSGRYRLISLMSWKSGPETRSGGVTGG